MRRRVIVIAPWSSYRGMRGEVVQDRPLMVRLDGDDPQPICVSEREVISEEESTPHLTAGE